MCVRVCVTPAVKVTRSYIYIKYDSGAPHKSRASVISFSTELCKIARIDALQLAVTIFGTRSRQPCMLLLPYYLRWRAPELASFFPE